MFDWPYYSLYTDISKEICKYIRDVFWRFFILVITKTFRLVSGEF